jgi:hypothetical protein
MFKFILQLLVALSELIECAEKSRLAGQQVTRFMVPIIPIQEAGPVTIPGYKILEGWPVYEHAFDSLLDCTLTEEEQDLLGADWAYWNESNVDLTYMRTSNN